MKHILDRSIRRVKKLLGASLVAAVFIIPIFLTTRWVGAVITNQDPRSTMIVSHQAPVYKSLHPFEEPLVTVTFDDGWESIYSNGLPILQKYDVRTTQYILSGEFDNHSYFSEAQVRSFIEAGHDIGSHTVSHKNLTTVSNDQLQHELGQSQSKLNELFGDIDDFASPHSAFNDTVINEVKKNYRSHRNTYADIRTVDEFDVNLKSNFDMYNIYAFTVTKDTTVQDLKKLVTYAKQNNGWAVLCYHQIDTSDTFYSVTPEAFEKQMKYLRSAGIKMPTMDEVLDIMQERS